MRGTARLLVTLSQCAQGEGERWANEIRSRIHGEQRRAAGGWPGTMSEARARLFAHVLPKLMQSGAPCVSEKDREEAARCLYRSARAQWMQTQEPEEELGS